MEVDDDSFEEDIPKPNNAGINTKPIVEMGNSASAPRLNSKNRNLESGANSYGASAPRVNSSNANVERGVNNTRRNNGATAPLVPTASAPYSMAGGGRRRGKKTRKGRKSSKKTRRGGRK